MSYNYKVRLNELKQMPTVAEILQEEEAWVKAHAPVDRAVKLNLFQFRVIQPEEVGANLPALSTIGALQPLAEMQTVPAVQFNEHAMNQLLTRLDIPQRLWDRWDTATKFIVVNKMFQNDSKLERDVLLRIQDNSLVRALFSSRFEPYDNIELIKALMPFCADAKVQVAFNDEMTTNISLTFPNTATEIKVGDIVEQGIHIRNSEVGLSSVTVAGFLFRAKCTNGLVGGGDSGSYRFRHTGDGDSLRERVQSAVESAVLEARKITAQFQDALKIAIDNPIDRLQKIVDDNNLSKEDFNQFINSFTMEPDKSLFGVVNAITRTASVIDGDKAYELQRLGTKLLADGK